MVSEPLSVYVSMVELSKVDRSVYLFSIIHHRGKKNKQKECFFREKLQKMSERLGRKREELSREGNYVIISLTGKQHP
jgi:hypothetical protein